ncbi:MAG: KOW domain-containing RNA-binding protein [Clostridiales bacterium]|nr:KOW domain-containing RNA-binding protein [Clostridiales bacterium]
MKKKKKKTAADVLPDRDSEYAGAVALSLSGHDAGREYVVVGGASIANFLYVSDGKHHRVTEPKLKNKKHLAITDAEPVLREAIRGGGATDADIRTCLNLFRRAKKSAPIPNNESENQNSFPTKG